jgi:hypothetical protein
VFWLDSLEFTTPHMLGLQSGGGRQQRHLYCWETASGKLLRSWPAHYKVGLALLDAAGCCLVLDGVHHA